MEKRDLQPGAFRKLTLAAGTVLLLSQGLSSAALAVPVAYEFSTGLVLAGPPSSAAAALAGLSVSGSFIYDSEAALLAAPASGAYYQGITSLSGTVGSYSFSDSSGFLTTVQNDLYSPPGSAPGAPLDLLQFSAEPLLGAAGNYDLAGFSVGGLTLANVRLFWIETLIAGAPDFLSTGNLPATPPTFSGRLALDFVASPYTPIDGQPSPTLPALSIAFFDNLTVRPATTSVPEPETLTLFALGLMGVALAKRRTRSV